MEELALRLDASCVVCLIEPRIVEALFDRAGSLLILVQDESSPQCRRLSSRSQRHSDCTAHRLWYAGSAYQWTNSF